MRKVWSLELPFGYFKALRQGKKEGCSCVRGAREKGKVKTDIKEDIKHVCRRQSSLEFSSTVVSFSRLPQSSIRVSVREGHTLCTSASCLGFYSFITRLQSPTCRRTRWPRMQRGRFQTPSDMCF